MNEHLLVKAELLKSEHFTDSEHSMGCKFLCVGVPSFSTEGILGLEEVEFTTFYTGPKAASYLTHLKIGCSSQPQVILYLSLHRKDDAVRFLLS